MLYIVSMDTSESAQIIRRRPVHLPDETHRRLKVLAARRGRTIEAEARRAIERYLQREERRP